MKILLVEDTRKLAEIVGRGLREEGHQVDMVARGNDAREQGLSIDYDVVILDWMLPDLDGIEVLRDWRAHGLQVPVLMLTARGSTPEKVTGLRAGADDYLAKPFDFEELLARIEALHRRNAGIDRPREVGDVTLDVRGRQLVGPGGAVDLTAREYALAAHLFERVGDAVTRAELLSAVWGANFDGEPNIVEVYVGYLRKKLQRVGASKTTIRTVRGVGYRLRAEAP
ncbi:MAG: response regulator transcription factor [Deltaproteobacteria bacterium]